MKIDMGNFGNAQREVVNTQINRGNPAELAEAKISSGRVAREQQQQANQAWNQVGENMQQLGGELWHKQQQLAQQKVGLTIQQKELYAQGVLQDADDKVQTGQLKSADLQKYIADKMSGFKYDDIDALGEAGRDQLTKGLQSVDMRVSGQTNHLYRQAHQVETRATTDEMIANNERLALNNGPDVSKAAALYDSEGFQAQAREAYGASYQAKINEAKGNLWKASAANQVLNARDSYSGLTELQNQINHPDGLYHGKLDPDAQLSVLGQIESRKSTLEAKAEAAAARAEAARDRAARQAEVKTNLAMRAQDHMEQFIASGNVPSDDMIEKYRQSVAGTPLEGSEKTVAKMAVAVTQFSAQPFDVQQAQLDAKATQMRAGTTPEEVKIFNLQQNALNTQRDALRKDPIGSVAIRTGADIPPLPIENLQQGGTPDQQHQQAQAFSEILYQRKALNDQARQQDKSVPVTLLTPEEKAQYKQTLAKLAPPQRAQFLATVQNAGGKLGPQLIKDIGGTDVDNAAAYHLNATPHAPTGELLVEGQALISKPGSNYKFEGSNKTKAQAYIDDKLAGAVPASQRATLQNTVNAYYVALRARNGADPSKYDDGDYEIALRDVVGDVVQYGAKGQIIVPKGTDENAFRDQLYKAIQLHPEGPDINGQLQNGGAVLRPVGAHAYAVTQPSGAPWLGKDGKPITIGLQ